jgi:NitT/TauT family transport system substrate-binding protein
MKKIGRLGKNNFLIAGIIGIILFILVVNCPNACAEENITIKITSTPTPNMIPVFLLLEHSELSQYEIELEYIPSKDVSDIIAHLTRGDIDFVSFSIPSGIKIYNQGIKNIKLIGAHVWKAIYVISNQDINKWEDLKGERILIPFRGGEPDIIARASMKSEGFNPDKDFRIEYLSLAHIKRLVFSGQICAAVIPEPHISQLLINSKGLLKVVIRPQQGLSSSLLNWKNEELPLGGFWLVSANLRDEIVQKVINAFAEANHYAMNYPEETADIVNNYFKKYFHSELPKEVIFDSLSSGRLMLHFKEIKKTDLQAFLKALDYPLTDEGVYYVP